jgi:hypothetical protein
MLQLGDSFLRRRLNVTAKDEFPVLSDFLAAEMTDYVAIISRFASEGIIGEMDGVYSSWATRVPDGFSNDQIAALQHLAPYLALAIKSVPLARMTGTLMETYLGRDAGQRVLGGRIVRGIAERIDAVVWFSDLRDRTAVFDISTTACARGSRKRCPATNGHASTRRDRKYRWLARFAAIRRAGSPTTATGLRRRCRNAASISAAGAGS